MNVRGPAATIGLRLVDQALWSASFFAFNIVSASHLSTSDYASLTIATALGVIGAACARAYALDAPAVAGARLGLTVRDAAVRRRTLAAVSSVVAAVAAGVTFLWLSLASDDAISWLPLLAAVIVLADGPHYALTLVGAFVRALVPALVYVVVAAVTAGAAWGGLRLDVVAIWTAALLTTGLVGTALRQHVGAARAIPYGVSGRMAAESLYGALSSQAGILVLFFVSSPDDTAGVRLAYAVVFAPVFSVIQGMTPLLLRRMSALVAQDARHRERTTLALWLSVGTMGIIASGAVGAVIVSSGLTDETFGTVLPFLVPVGASMLGTFVLDACLLQIRFRTHPRVPHRARLIVVTIDIVLQLGLTITLGAAGLIIALIVGAVVKTAGSAALVLVHSKTAPSPEPVEAEEGMPRAP